MCVSRKNVLTANAGKDVEKKEHFYPVAGYVN
jgi:hypothetical protein